MTRRLVGMDAILLRLNLILLLRVSLLPFPTRLVAKSLEGLSGERVFVTMYGSRCRDPHPAVRGR
jgi:hypothetical protein